VATAWLGVFLTTSKAVDYRELTTFACLFTAGSQTPIMAKGKRRVNPVDYFPAEPRADGRYQKKIRGRFFYFGGHGIGRDSALADYQRVRHQLYSGEVAGAIHPHDYGTWTLRDFGNKYLDARRAEVVAGTLRKVTYADLRYALLQFVRYVGTRRRVTELSPAVFTSTANHFKGSLSGCRWNHIVSAVNAWLNYSVAHGWIERLPVFGPDWKKIPLNQLPRRDRMVSPDELGRLLDVCTSEQMRAMILLAANCGIGPTDLASLRAVHIQGGVIRNRRGKTGIQRVAPLWPETLAAIEDWLTARVSNIPELFVTKYGRAWDGPDVVHEFTDLRRAAGFDMDEHWGLGAFRHTFSTVADDHGDGNAKRMILGQQFPGIDAVYVAGKRLERLREVVELVRQHFITPLSRLDSATGHLATHALPAFGVRAPAVPSGR
jgi:integrase